MSHLQNTATGLQVCLVSHLPSPYQVEFLNAIAREGNVQLRVIYLWKNDIHHTWTIPDLLHKHLVLTQSHAHWSTAWQWLTETHLAIFNYYTHPFAIAALWARNISGKPWCFWGERPGFLKLGRWGSYFRKALLHPLKNNTVPIWGVGDFALSGYQKDWGENRPFVNLPYFSDLNRFSSQASKKPASKTFVILYSGMLVPRKDVLGLAQAFSQLAIQHPHIRLAVLGSGPKENEMRSILQPVANQVDWLGFRPWHELPAIYAAADLLCIPSRHDGWALVVPEALAAGLPVVSTNCTGAAVQFIKHRQNGWLINADSLDHLENAVREAITMPPANYARMRAAAVATISKHNLPDGAARFTAAAQSAMEAFHCRVVDHPTPSQPSCKNTLFVLAANYPGDHLPSMERYTRLLLDSMTAQGFQIILKKPAQRVGLMVPTDTRKWAGYIDKYIIFPLLLRRWINAQHPDTPIVVHVTDQGNGIYLPWLQGIATLVTCHDLIAVKAALGKVNGHQRPLHRSWLQRLIRFSLNKAGHLVCVSEKTTSDCIALLDLEKNRYSTVYNPLDPAFKTNLYPPKADDLPTSYLLHVGNSSWYKNRIAVLTIYARLRCLMPDAPRLVLIGEDLTREEIKLIQALGIIPWISLKQEVSNAYLASAYHHALALIFPSREEGFGWPILEAMSMGCPVFTTNRPPMTEIGGDAIEYMDPQNCDAAATLIADKLLLGKSWRETIAAKARQRAEYFSMQRFSDGMAAIYRHIETDVKNQLLQPL